MSEEENIGGKTPEDSSGQMPTMRLSKGTAIQHMLETSADAEIGLMFMPEWAREPVELRSPGHFTVSYLGSVEEPGQEVKIPGHAKSMVNLSLVMCKMLKLPSPVINDKLISILSSFLPTCRKCSRSSHRIRLETKSQGEN